MSSRAATSGPTRLLPAESDPSLRRVLYLALQARSYQVALADTTSTALELATQVRPDLIILDLVLPGAVDAVRVLRHASTTPILLLTWPIEPDPRAALHAGADDYVTKPFNVGELLARIRAVTRRLSSPGTPPATRIGRYRVDLADRRVEDTSPSGQGVHLSPIEWRLLEVLVRNPGKLVSQRQLLQEVWGPTCARETDYLRQYMKHLRRKLEDDPTRPRHLITEPGMGYRFQPAPDSQPATNDPITG